MLTKDKFFPSSIAVNPHSHFPTMPPSLHVTNERCDMSEHLAASVAAIPKEETLYESLLRYHEEEKQAMMIESSIATKSVSVEDDRKFPAKPRPVFQRSHSATFYERFLSTSGRLIGLITDDHDKSPSFPAYKQEVSVAEPSLFSIQSSLHPMSLDERFDRKEPNGLRQHNRQSCPSSAFSGPYPPAPCVERAIADYSKRNDLAHHNMSSFYKSVLDACGEPLSSFLASELCRVADDEELARELAREQLKLEQEYARKLELDEKLAHELARRLELEGSLPESQDADPGQLKILQKIREEAERKKIKKSLQDSCTAMNSGSDSEFLAAPKGPGTTASPNVDYLLSRQLAMGEWQEEPRTPIRRNRAMSDQRDSQHRVSFSDSDILTAPRAPEMTAPPHTDSLLSHQQAMVEWQQVPRPPKLRRHGSLRDRRDAPHSASFSEAEALLNRNEEPLLQQESMKAKRANRSRSSCQTWRKIVKLIALALFKKGRSRIDRP